MSGEKLVDNLNFRDQILRFAQEAAGGEMEGAGLYTACVERNTEWVVVKAICDWADGNKSENKTERQKTAANESSGFILHAIAQRGFAPMRQPGRTENSPGIIPELKNKVVPLLSLDQAAPPVEFFTLSAPLDDQEREALLDRVQEEAIEPKLRQHLRRVIRLDLNITDISGAFAPKLRILESPASPDQGRPVKEPVSQFFEESAGGRLLILGEPGTGKTNLLLELAESLIAEARKNVESQLPIVFNLARWTNEQRNRTLHEWMKDDLRESYGLSAAAAGAMVDEGRILPLFDGLDEVAADRRDSCVSAILEYQLSRGMSRMAICCRTQEYQNLQKTLIVGATLEIGKLTSADVEREIERPGLGHVRQALIDDPELRPLIETPLWLHVLFLAALIRAPVDTALTPRDRLYGRFVRYALDRTLGGARIPTKPQQLLHWLGCLAAEMQKRDQAQFAVEDPDMSWVSTKLSGRLQFVSQLVRSASSPGSQKRIKLWHRIGYGVGGFLLGWLVDGVLFHYGPLLGTAVGILAAVRLEGTVDPAEELSFSWSDAVAQWKYGIVSGPILGTVFGIGSGLIGGILVGILVGLFEILQGGFRPRSLSRGVEPNQKTSRSVHYALQIAKWGALAALLLAVIGAVGTFQGSLSENTSTSFARAGAWIAFGAIILGCEKGGWFALRHYIVRFLLWTQGTAPLSYVAFLEETVERLFLIRRGNSYEFLHLTFRDYMAEVHGPDHHDSSRSSSRRRPGLVQTELISRLLFGEPRAYPHHPIG